MKSVQIFTDGSAKGNPGPGGNGTILEFTDKGGFIHSKELSQGYEMTTNNRMELMAAIAGLEALAVPCEVEIISDSKYLINAFNEDWISGWIRSDWKKGREQVKNSDLWKRLLSAMKTHKVKFTWVKGHAGFAENERCDQLACEAAGYKSKIIDEGFQEDASAQPQQTA